MTLVSCNLSMKFSMLLDVLDEYFSISTLVGEFVVYKRVIRVILYHCLIESHG